MRTSVPNARFALLIAAVACLLASSACAKRTARMDVRLSRPSESSSIQADESANPASLRLVSAEARYLEILKKAATIEDTLDGAEKLSNVRGRIEQLQREMNYLNAQIEMSSLEISLATEAGSTVLGVKWRPFRQTKIALGKMISGLADWADAVIAFFINLPLILVWTASVIALLFVALRALLFSWKKLGPKTDWRWPKFLSRGNPGAS